MRETEGAAERAYEGLLRLILTGELEPGDNLPALTLAARLGTSRTPVREALRRLASEGLVLIIPNSGARVASPSRREMEDAYVVREDLEVLAVRLAAGRVSDRHLRRLEETLLEEERAFSERNLELYLEVNEGFHKIIAEASGNRVLKEYVENILARTNVYIVFYDPFYDIESNSSTTEHRAIIDALRAQDADAAANLMRQHIRVSQNSLDKPEDFEPRN